MGNGGLPELEEQSHWKKNRMKMSCNGCLHRNGGQVSKLSCKNVTFSSTSSPPPHPNIEYRHLTSSAIHRNFQHVETWKTPQRSSWTGGMFARKSFDIDPKPKLSAGDLENSSQLQRSCSSVEHRKGPSIDNSRRWLDNLNFSMHVEIPMKKKRLWNWKPLQALAPIRQLQFRCMFSLHVHNIEGLPKSMNDLLVSVHWRRRNGGEQTMPVSVCEGTATIEETLYQNSTIYCRKSPSQSMHYNPKVFMLFVTAVDAKWLDFGNHRINLSTLLPRSSLLDIENAEPPSFTTTFKLTGKAKGGTLTVTFSYKIPYNELKQMWKREMGYGDSSPCEYRDSVDTMPHSDLDYQDSSMNEITSEISMYVKQMKHEEGRTSLASLFALESDIMCSKSSFHIGESSGSFTPVACQDNSECLGVDDDIDYTVVEKTPEMGSGINLSSFGSNNVISVSCFKPREDEGRTDSDMNVQQAQQLGTTRTCSEESADSKVHLMFDQHEQEWDNDLGELYARHDEDSIEAEFLNLLDKNYDSFHFSSENDPDSSKACLLKQFERESLAGVGSSETEFCGPFVSHAEQLYKGSWGSNEDSYLASIVQAAESEFEKATQTICSKLRAQLLENEEVEELLEKWGLDEKDFQSSPLNNVNGLGSSIDFHPLELVDRPPLAKGLGPVVKMRDGGFLSSMSPMLFDCSKKETNLVMQVSRPLVVPTDTGSSVMDVLCSLASLGAEALYVQAKTMMPLEDITGKSVHQLALEARSGHDISETRQFIGSEFDKELDHNEELVISQATTRRGFATGELEMFATNDTNGEVVYFEELIPSAMDKIESLVIEGLKIQSDMAEHDATSDVYVPSPEEEERRMEKYNTLGLESITGMALSDATICDQTDDGLMAMAITLDEWMQLDAAMAGKEADERKSEILRDPHDCHSELTIGQHSKCNAGEMDKKKQALERFSMKDTLTIALRIQLRDPFRNHEPIGAPMMALIKAERIAQPPRPTTGRRVPDKFHIGIIEETKDGKEEPTQFKVTGVHVAGLKVQENTRANSWSTPKQQKAGSRWLIANGMAKSQKHPLQKFKQATPSKVKIQPGDTLWSISTRFHGSGSKWNEVAALNPHIRNPDIILANETINLR